MATFMGRYITNGEPTQVQAWSLDTRQRKANQIYIIAKEISSFLWISKETPSYGPAAFGGEPAIFFPPSGALRVLMAVTTFLMSTTTFNFRQLLAQDKKL